MSHFTVSVITKGQPTEEQIAELLAPYQENNMGDCPKEYLRFNSITEEYKKKYETETRTMIVLEDGSFYPKYETSFYDEVSKEVFDKTSPQKRNYLYGKYYVMKDLDSMGARIVEKPFKEIYSSFDQFMEEYEEYELDEEMNDYGFWENPDAKWDWWTIGGRWRGKIIVDKTSETCLGDSFPYDDKYKTVDCARIKDIRLPRKDLEYKEALRFWEMKVEGREPETESEKEQLKEDFYTSKYYIKTYGDKETYARLSSLFYTHALIDKEGQWLEQGEMGWFGCSSTTRETLLDYFKEFSRIVFEEAEEDDYITIVDCHI